MATTVRIFNHKFTPKTIDVSKGSSITFRNEDPVQHTITFDQSDPNIQEHVNRGQYTDWLLNPGQVVTVKFIQSGSFNYKDRLNTGPGLRGTVAVKEKRQGTKPSPPPERPIISSVDEIARNGNQQPPPPPVDEGISWGTALGLSAVPILGIIAFSMWKKNQ